MQLFEHLQGFSFIAYNSPDKAMDQLQVFDDGLAILSPKRILLCCSVSKRFWLCLSLPLQFGGSGLLSSGYTVPAAFLASYHM